MERERLEARRSLGATSSVADARWAAAEPRLVSSAISKEAARARLTCQTTPVRAFFCSASAVTVRGGAMSDNRIFIAAFEWKGGMVRSGGRGRGGGGAAARCGGTVTEADRRRQQRGRGGAGHEMARTGRWLRRSVWLPEGGGGTALR